MNHREPVSVAVTIPAFNEAATVAQVIGSIPKDIPGVRNIDVIVINDGSTDDTAKVAAEAGLKILKKTYCPLMPLQWSRRCGELLQSIIPSLFSLTTIWTLKPNK